MNGGIRGFGNYINSYGDGIKASMAANGPTTATKTAVKPAGGAPVKAPAAPKALPSTGGAMKALPSTGGVPKALPSTGAAPKALPAPAPKKPTTAIGGAKPPMANGKVRLPDSD